MKKIIFIVGPTATGKSDVAYLLAKRIQAEVISCDSMLVYKEPSIITAKPAKKILLEIPHHFINLISVTEKYSVYDYYQNATGKIKELYKRKIPVIVCGGTGLYFKVLLDGIFDQPEKSDALRKELRQEAKEKGTKSLYNKLKKVDQKTAEKISENDQKRIIRALEVYQLTGETLAAKKKEAKGLWGEIPIKVFGLKLSRDNLYQRIDERVDQMFSKRAVDEVKRLLSKNLSITAEKIIGITEISDYLRGEKTIEQAKEKIKQNTRRFAKRQITWFKKDSRIEWYNGEGKTAKEVTDEIGLRTE